MPENWLRIYLLVGPDKDHTVLFPVLHSKEMLLLLAVEWSIVFKDTPRDTELGQRINKVVNHFLEKHKNTGYFTNPAMWKWQGIVLMGEGHQDHHTIRWAAEASDSPIFKAEILKTQEEEESEEK